MKLPFLFGSIIALSLGTPVGAKDDRFKDPGDLLKDTGTGQTISTVYYPEMRFPLEAAPAFLNSQVYSPGGMHGGAGGQCAPANYDYPWRDNFCETREWKVGMCPAGKGHQGQDIRPATCNAGVHWAVAAQDGTIVQIGKYSVTLQSPSGTIFRYLHLDMGKLAVKPMQKVKAGDRIGKVSNHFGGAATTTHLHFDIKDTAIINGKKVVSYMPPYSSLLASYKKLPGVH